MTTLQTFKAIINGKLVVVDQLKGDKGRQDIRYKLHQTQYVNNGFVVTLIETTLESSEFWKLNPIKVN